MFIFSGFKIKLLILNLNIFYFVYLVYSFFDYKETKNRKYTCKQLYKLFIVFNKILSNILFFINFQLVEYLLYFLQFDNV
jgi:hypothetical protein